MQGVYDRNITITAIDSVPSISKNYSLLLFILAHLREASRNLSRENDGKMSWLFHHPIFPYSLTLAELAILYTRQNCLQIRASSFPVVQPSKALFWRRFLPASHTLRRTFALQTFFDFFCSDYVSLPLLRTASACALSDKDRAEKNIPSRVDEKKWKKNKRGSRAVSSANSFLAINFFPPDSATDAICPLSFRSRDIIAVFNHIWLTK